MSMAKKGNGGGKDKGTFPYPYKPGQHETTHEQAVRYRKRATAVFGTCGIGEALGYHRDIFTKILSQPDCQGIRVYPGIDDEGRFSLLFAGFDSKGNNILKGTIGNTPFRCPPFCPPNGGGVLK